VDKQPHAVIVGAGPNGLTAAARLATARARAGVGGGAGGGVAGSSLLALPQRILAAANRGVG